MSNLAEERRYTYADYIKWDEDTRYELIDGVAYAMAAPSRLHQKINMELSRQLSNFLRGKPCEVYAAPFDVRLNAESYDDIVVQPDILVVCDESKHDGGSVTGAPDFIVEILSPKNTKHDTDVKFRLYQKAGVKEYWIVNPFRRTVEVYILRGGKYGAGKIYVDNDAISVYTLPGCKINMADVFYDIESDINENESIYKQKIIEALKKNDLYSEQISKIIENIKIT